MLEIRANGELLDLPPDIVITLIFENPLMQNTRVPTPHSLTFDLPPTKRNMRICRYPDRITVSSRFKTADASLKFGPITFMTGHFKLSGFDDKIKAVFVGHTAVENLRKKLWDVPFAEYDFGLAQLTVNPDPRYGSKWVIARNTPGNVAYNYNQFMNNSYASPTFYKAPIRVKAGQWYDYRTGTQQLYEKSVDSQYLNFYDTRNSRFDYPARTGATNANVRPYLFPYLSYLFQELFGELLIENPFTDPDLEDLVLVTSYHPAYYLFSSYLRYEDFQAMMFDNYNGQSVPFHPTLGIGSYLPDMPSIELLISLMKMFCMSLYTLGDKFKLKYNSEIIDSTDKDNWDEKLIGRIRTGVRDLQYYKYGYENNDDEPVIVKDGNILNTIEELILRTNTEDVPIDTYHITTTGEYYTKEITDDGAIYTRLNSGFGKSEENSKNAFETTSAISPLPMCITDYFNLQPPLPGTAMPALKKWYVPEFDGDRMVRSTGANIMFARGFKNAFSPGESYPFLSPSNYDAFGVRMGDVSLAWEGNDGLLARYHLPFKNWVEKEKLPISGAFHLSASELKNLDLSKKKHIKGKDFFIERLQVSITMNNIEPAEVDLLEA